jgi:hypothetical protein
MKPRKILVALGLAGLLGLLLFVVWMFHSRAVARYERQLLAAGEKLRIEDFVSTPTPPDKNGAPLFMEAMGGWISAAPVLDRNPPAAMRMIAPGKAIVGSAQPDVRGDQTNNSWPEVEEALAPLGDRIEGIREAAERPVFDFHLNYRQGFTLLLPHLAPLKRAEQLLAAATLCDLHHGDAASATTNIEAMLKLVKATDKEPIVISQLVRIAMAQISVPVTWELLQCPNVTDPQLAAIQGLWTDLRFTQATEDALAFERAEEQMTLDRMRRSSTEFRQVVSMSRGGGGSPSMSFGKSGDALLREVVLGTQEAEWRWFLSYPDQLRALKGEQVLLEGFRKVQAGHPFCEVMSGQSARLAELGFFRTNDHADFLFNLSNPDLRSLLSGSVVSLGRVINRVFANEVAREATLTAIALKRYHLRHGHYPAALSALVPDFLPAAPRDPADGQPLRYRLKPDGTYLLYSVGEDGVDDGGDAAPTEESKTPNWEKGRDYVWPWPASAEEIAAWRQKNGKKGGKGEPTP